MSSVSIIRNLTKKQQIRQTSIKLDNENYRFDATNYCDIRWQPLLFVIVLYELLLLSYMLVTCNILMLYFLE